MSSSESEFDPREALDEIDQDLDNLEAVLKPLLTSSWQEIISTLGNMEQAKMNMIMAYGICDLIWSELSSSPGRFSDLIARWLVFLRLKGLDPDKHPVMKELVSAPRMEVMGKQRLKESSQDRIKTYYIKVRDAENAPKRKSNPV